MKKLFSFLAVVVLLAQTILPNVMYAAPSVETGNPALDSAIEQFLGEIDLNQITALIGEQFGDEITSLISNAFGTDINLGNFTLPGIDDVAGLLQSVAGDIVKGIVDETVADFQAVNQAEIQQKIKEASLAFIKGDLTEEQVKAKVADILDEAVAKLETTLYNAVLNALNSKAITDKVYSAAYGVAYDTTAYQTAYDSAYNAFLANYQDCTSLGIEDNVDTTEINEAEEAIAECKALNYEGLQDSIDTTQAQLTLAQSALGIAQSALDTYNSVIATAQTALDEFDTNKGIAQTELANLEQAKNNAEGALNDKKSSSEYIAQKGETDVAYQAYYEKDVENADKVANAQLVYNNAIAVAQGVKNTALSAVSSLKTVAETAGVNEADMVTYANKIKQTCTPPKN
jgi:chromosome segregation ATPase